MVVLEVFSQNKNGVVFRLVSYVVDRNPANHVGCFLAVRLIDHRTAGHDDDGLHLRRAPELHFCHSLIETWINGSFKDEFSYWKMVYIYIHMYHIQLAMWILQKAGFFIAKFFRLEEIFSNGSCEVREILETMKVQWRLGIDRFVGSISGPDSIEDSVDFLRMWMKQWAVKINIFDCPYIFVVCFLNRAPFRKWRCHISKIEGLRVLVLQYVFLKREILIFQFPIRYHIWNLWLPVANISGS